MRTPPACPASGLRSTSLPRPQPRCSPLGWARPAAPAPSGPLPAALTLGCTERGQPLQLVNIPAGCRGDDSPPLATAAGSGRGDPAGRGRGGSGGGPGAGPGAARGRGQPPLPSRQWPRAPDVSAGSACTWARGWARGAEQSGRRRRRRSRSRSWSCAAQGPLRAPQRLSALPGCRRPPPAGLGSVAPVSAPFRGRGRRRCRCPEAEPTMSRPLPLNPTFLPPTYGVLKSLLENPLKLPLAHEDGEASPGSSRCSGAPGAGRVPRRPAHSPAR